MIKSAYEKCDFKEGVNAMEIQKRYFGNKHATLSEYHVGKHDYSEHIHHFLEVICVLDGEIEITVDGITEVAKKGDIAVIPSFCPHSQHTENYCNIWIGLVSPVWVAELFFGKTFYKPEKIVFTPSATAFAYITEKMPPEKWVRRGRAMTEDFFRKIKTLYYAIFEEYFTKVEITPFELNDNALAATYVYISEHFKEDLTLKKVAAAIGYSPKHISHCLSEIPGSSFCNILNSARINYASKLLRTTDMTVVDIALKSGFASETVFYGVFKKIKGMTPNQYRSFKKLGELQSI